MSWLGSIKAWALRPLGSNPVILADLYYDSIPLLNLHETFERVVFDKPIRQVNFYEERGAPIRELPFLPFLKQFVSDTPRTLKLLPSDEI
jgi:hypothetical protein